MLNNTSCVQDNLKGRHGDAAPFVWKLVPETKGKTLEEISTLWKKRKQ